MGKTTNSNSKTIFNYRVVLVYPILGILALIMLFPFVYMFFVSLQGKIYMLPIAINRIIPESFNLLNYVRVIKDTLFIRWFLNSVIVSTICVIAQLFFNSLAAFVFARREFPGKNILFIIVLATMMVPPVMTLIPSFMLVVFFGAANSYTGLVINRLASPFGLFMMRQFMQTIPSELEEVAKLDGAGEFQIFYKIILPLVKPGLAVLGIFTFMQTWNNLIWPLVVVTKDRMSTIPLGLATLQSQFFTDYGLMLAASFLSFFPILIVFVFAQRYFIEGLTIGAMKG